MLKYMDFRAGEGDAGVEGHHVHRHVVPQAALRQALLNPLRRGLHGGQLQHAGHHRGGHGIEFGGLILLADPEQIQLLCAGVFHLEVGHGRQPEEALLFQRVPLALDGDLHGAGQHIHIVLMGGEDGFLCSAAGEQMQPAFQKPGPHGRRSQKVGLGQLPLRQRPRHDKRLGQQAEGVGNQAGSGNAQMILLLQPHVRVNPYRIHYVIPFIGKDCRIFTD
ncbi:hypothetical protein SDC9_106293 [bioreactor metagenome]|uniref:Uncharacterized protein n=1 Tax=bioreactor metagenome TaxID=1076179 RepID=A0A645B4E6_9ZZZZ